MVLSEVLKLDQWLNCVFVKKMDLNVILRFFSMLNALIIVVSQGLGGYLVFSIYRPFVTCCLGGVHFLPIFFPNRTKTEWDKERKIMIIYS
jgi:hypothetical protein